MFVKKFCVAALAVFLTFAPIGSTAAAENLPAVKIINPIGIRSIPIGPMGAENGDTCWASPLTSYVSQPLTGCVAVDFNDGLQGHLGYLYWEFQVTPELFNIWDGNSSLWTTNTSMRIEMEDGYVFEDVASLHLTAGVYKIWAFPVDGSQPASVAVGGGVSENSHEVSKASYTEATFELLNETGLPRTFEAYQGQNELFSETVTTTQTVTVPLFTHREWEKITTVVYEGDAVLQSEDLFVHSYAPWQREVAFVGAGLVADIPDKDTGCYSSPLIGRDDPLPQECLRWNFINPTTITFMVTEDLVNAWGSPQSFWLGNATADVISATGEKLTGVTDFLATPGVYTVNLVPDASSTGWIALGGGSSVNRLLQGWPSDPHPAVAVQNTACTGTADLVVHAGSEVLTYSADCEAEDFILPEMRGTWTFVRITGVWSDTGEEVDIAGYLYDPTPTPFKIYMPFVSQP